MNIDRFEPKLIVRREKEGKRGGGREGGREEIDRERVEGRGLKVTGEKHGKMELDTQENQNKIKIT